MKRVFHGMTCCILLGKETLLALFGRNGQLLTCLNLIDFLGGDVVGLAELLHSHTVALSDGGKALTAGNGVCLALGGGFGAALLRFAVFLDSTLGGDSEALAGANLGSVLGRDIVRHQDVLYCDTIALGN